MTTETFVADALGRPTITKDPTARLDYSWDWTPWLTGAQDSIQSVNVTGTGCTVENSSFNAGVVTAWVSGGVAYVPATLTCKITTAGNRIDERTVYLKIVQR
jgi:hypothetical protein